jgi:hypothetical protein
MNTESSVPFNWRSPFDLNHPAGGMLSGLVAGLIAGIVTGIAARLVMRIFALTLGGTPIFTIEGTLVIIRAGATFGILIGMIFGFFQPFFSGSIIKKGLKYGLFWSAAMAVMQVANREAIEEAPLMLVLPLSAILPILYGIILGWLTAKLIPKEQMNGNALAQTLT